MAERGTGGTDGRGTGERTARTPGAEEPPDAAPEAFRAAVEDLRGVRLRAEVELSEIDPPRRLAPYAAAFTADVPVPAPDGGEDGIADGRLILLHDPDGQDSWRGTFRFVILVRAELEPEMAADPPVVEVGWSWLLDALAGHDASFIEPSGTVTLCASHSFGRIAARPPTTEVEIRASWTAAEEPGDGRFGAHLAAWAELLCLAAGIPPEQPGVTVIPRRGPA